MALSFPKLITTLPCWFTPGRWLTDTVICTMGRLVRNLQGHPFPGWSGAEDRAAVADALLPILKEQPEFKSAFLAEMPKLSFIQRMLLLERKQITPSMAARQDGCHVLISRDQDTVAMVNEEEHLCVHTSVADLDGAKVLERLQDMAGRLERVLPIARNHTDGYLTSLPSEAGEGLQLYAILHLPALQRADMMDQVRRGLEKLHLNLTPFYAESGEDVGAAYVLFTNAIPQGLVQEWLGIFTKVCRLLANRESAMRDKLAKSLETRDAVMRAYAAMRYSLRMDFKEMAAHLSLLRLGIQCGFLELKDTEGLTPMAARKELIRVVSSLYTVASPAMLRLVHKDDKSKEDMLRHRSKYCSIIADKLEPVLSV